MKKPYHGIYIVAACFVVLFFGWGMVLNTFPIFLVPVTEDMEWGRGALLMALLMGSVGTLIAAPVAGTAMDKIGVRPVMTVGTIIIGSGLLLGSRISHLWELYIIFAFIGIGLMCATIIACAYVISNWYVSRRGMAMSFAFVGTSFGGMIMSPIVEWIIRIHGWRTAFVVAGIEMFVFVLPVVLLVIRSRPSDLGLEPYRDAKAEADTAGENWGVSAKEALSLRVFWQIAAIMLIIGLVTGGLGNNCPAYLRDIGHSSQRAALAWAAVMGAMILGKLAIGPIADRWGAKNAMAGASVVFAVSIFILLFAQPYWVALVFAALYGFACSAPLIINPLLTSTYLGMRNFGALYGILSIMNTVGGAIGPVGAGLYHDEYKTYEPVFYLFIGIMIVCAVISVLIKPTPLENGSRS